ncbi:MAG: transglutaminase domain-containing protein, partial [Candidatus Omnitrophica bacterium]|nr:transglutaminase domain-containing protein [Candidatus Omnitrophota bacterium]
TVEPHPTNEVFKDRYGDCRGLSLLAGSMLQLAGISSRICLFANEFGGDPQNGLPNPSVFEHVILEILMDGGHYFVDPQAKGFDFGQWPIAYDNAHLFVIEDQGYRFDNMPVSKEEDNAIVSASDITVNPDGSAVFDVRVRMSLEGSQAFRETWASTTDKNKDKFFERLEASFTQGGTMIKREVKGLENRYGPVNFSLKYIAPNAYPVANDMILLKEADQSDVSDFAGQKRVYPIFVASNTLVKNTNTYHVPEGYQVNFVPKDYQMGIDFMDVSADYRKDGQTVVVNTLTRMKRARVSPQRYGEVKAFRNELYKKNDQYIVLKAKSQVSPQAKDWVKKQ